MKNLKFKGRLKDKPTLLSLYNGLNLLHNGGTTG